MTSDEAFEAYCIKRRIQRTKAAGELWAAAVEWARTHTPGLDDHINALAAGAEERARYAALVEAAQDVDRYAFNDRSASCAQLRAALTALEGRKS